MSFLSKLTGLMSPSRTAVRMIQGKSPTDSGPLTFRNSVDEDNQLGINPAQPQQPNTTMPMTGPWGQFGGRNQYFNNALARALQSPQQQMQPQQGMPAQPQQGMLQMPSQDSGWRPFPGMNPNPIPSPQAPAAATPPPGSAPIRWKIM